MGGQDVPSVHVVVELDRELSILTDEGRPVAQWLLQGIEAGLAMVYRHLGIHAEPSIEVRASETLRVLVDGRPEGYPQDLFRRMWEYVRSAPFGNLRLPGSWENWLGEPESEAKLADFLALFVVEVVKQSPARLLGTEQAHAYRELAAQVLQEDTGNLEALPQTRVANILTGVLNLKLSIADPGTVVPNILEDIALGHTDEEIVERLAPRLRSNWLEIRVHPDYLRRLINVEQGREPISVHDPDMVSNVRESFALMTDGLFYELGIRVPDIRFVSSDDVKENAFALKVQHLVGPPYIGLQPDQLLVNDTPQHLGLLGVEASEAISPDNNSQCSIIDARHQQAVETAGAKTWDPIGYLILCLARELRQNAWRLLDIEIVENELARLHQAYPELAVTTVETISPELLTRLLRELLSEQISIRDLRSILDRALTFDYVVTDPTKYVLLDDRLGLHERLSLGDRCSAENYAQHVRAGLKRYITDAYTYRRGQSNVLAYLLDPEIEERVLDHLAFEAGTAEKSRLTPDEIEELLEAVRSEVSSYPQSATMLPVILTISAIRRFVREMVATEFPTLAVLAYDELSPDTRIETVSRITV